MLLCFCLVVVAVVAVVPAAVPVAFVTVVVLAVLLLLLKMYPTIKLTSPFIDRVCSGLGGQAKQKPQQKAGHYELTSHFWPLPVVQKEGGRGHHERGTEDDKTNLLHKCLRFEFPRRDKSDL